VLYLRIDLGHDVFLLFADQVDKFEALLAPKLHFLHVTVHLQPRIVPLVLALADGVLDLLIVVRLLFASLLDALLGLCEPALVYLELLTQVDDFFCFCA